VASPDSCKKHSSNKLPKLGDRLWFWRDGPSSKFEKSLSALLRQLRWNNNILEVEIFSCDPEVFGQLNLIRDILPQAILLRNSCALCVYTTDASTKVQFPAAYLSFSHSASAGDVQVFCNECTISRQCFLICAACHEDIKVEQRLEGNLDLIRIVALLIGRGLLHPPIYFSYLCLEREKFISGELELRARSALDTFLCKWEEHSSPNLGTENDSVVQACLWFSAKAFLSQDQATKIFYYNTALEIIAGGHIQNHYRAIFRNRPDTKSLLEERLWEAQRSRGALVHNGLPMQFSTGLKRFIQALLFDAIVYRLTGRLEHSSFERLTRNPEHTEDT
jgi:hypothetical protein